MSLGRRLLELSELSDDFSLASPAYLAMGIPLFWRGQVAEALDHLEQATRLTTRWRGALAQIERGGADTQAPSSQEIRRTSPSSSRNGERSAAPPVSPAWIR